MTGIGSLVVRRVRLHVFRNVYKNGLRLGLRGSCLRLLSGSLRTRSCPRPGRFDADGLCFQLQDGWLTDLFVY